MYSKIYLYQDAGRKETFNNIDAFDVYIDNEIKEREGLGWKILYFSRTIDDNKSYGNLVCLSPLKMKAVTYYWEYIK